MIEIREILRERFHVLAPCTHREMCGLMSEENAGHWCHHFADAPPTAHQDPFWGHFRREMNLDVGPVAYSFLVLSQTAAENESGELSHLIGRPLKFPKFVRVLSCQADGVREMVAGRKVNIYRELKQNSTPAIYRFELKKTELWKGKKFKLCFAGS